MLREELSKLPLPPLLEASMRFDGYGDRSWSETPQSTPGACRGCWR